MPRGKGRKILPYRKAAAGRRPPPVAPRQVERQNLWRRRPRAQLEQAEDHGVPVQVQQPKDNDPQPAYQLLLLRTIRMKMLLHHVYFLYPKLYNRCHRLKMVRLLKSDIDVFVSYKMCNQILNLEYIDLAHLLYKNCVSNIEKPSDWFWWRWCYPSWTQQVLEGKIYHKYWRVVRGFLNYITILLKKYPALANDLISYMYIIRSAVPNVPFENNVQVWPTVPPKKDKGPQAIMGHNWWSIVVTVCSNWWAQCSTKHTTYVIYCK